MNQHGMSPAILEQAAEWLVKLDAGECRQAELDNWREAAPEHARALQSLQGMLGHFQQIAPGPARAALRAAHRKPGTRLGTALALCTALLLPGWLLWQHTPPSYLLADIRTCTGQWHSQRLDDGSQISLNGRSAVDLRFDARERRLQLLQGEILVDVAADRQRPFIVETAHGRIRALGTRFIVQQDGDGTRLLMLESKTAVSAAGSSQETQVAAGQQVRIDQHGVSTPGALDTRGLEQAWQQRQLVAQDRPLPEVLEELARHHRGYLRFDNQALRDLRVSAVLPLDDGPRALRLLAQSMGLTVSHYSPWITVIERAESSR
ncbi:FecR family protein [Phytopseudomonas dryadis]|nr:MULTISPECIES: FecR family protein [Pseudomonas]